MGETYVLGREPVLREVKERCSRGAFYAVSSAYAERDDLREQIEGLRHANAVLAAKLRELGVELEEVRIG